MNYALKVEGVSKRYSLPTTKKNGSSSIKDSLVKLFKNKQESFEPEETRVENFWALKNVDFMVEQGARLGVIGKNGAGKSTLLKILSRITEPTEGRILINGKMASLLEVGTGFHPELTGRENVFLNGSILGLSKSAVKAKFDQIIDFSGVEKFIDMPVKHYSSGMNVRLAFAVAAHLEPEILVLDEVLAVGDAAFQKKCLAKMNEISDAGTTVIFVSHGMGSIREYCNQALLLENGKVKCFTKNLDEAIDQYLDKQSAVNMPVWERSDSRYDTLWFQPLSLRLVDQENNTILRKINRNEEVFVEIRGHVSLPEHDLTIGYALFDENGGELYWSYPTDEPKNIGKHCELGERIFKGKVPNNVLNAGKYTLGIIGGIHNQKWLYQPHRSIPYVDIEVADDFCASPFWTQKRPGLLAINPSWQIK